MQTKENVSAVEVPATKFGIVQSNRQSVLTEEADQGLLQERDTDQEDIQEAEADLSITKDITIREVIKMIIIPGHHKSSYSRDSYSNRHSLGIIIYERKP